MCLELKMLNSLCVRPVYDVLTGAVVSRLSGHDACVRDVSWHPYEDNIVSSSVSAVNANCSTGHKYCIKLKESTFPKIVKGLVLRSKPDSVSSSNGMTWN